ncbi:MAG TPA: TetR/AcrR family transcriptional regulator [Woeseiaceae bacterium]|jgi:AcrR family transcriptional regulator|nr:TetR/AcrR family transcriptional regulator [Woeseiaceae bacterium]
MSRSEHRIPKLRTRGRQNRQRLMAEAERLLLESDGRPLRFSDVFEAAGVSRGSAYRIYIGIDDLMQDLATEWVNNFVDYLNSDDSMSTPDNWGELSDHIVQRCADYWTETSSTLRVMPRIRSVEPSSYRAAIHALSEVVSLLFNRYFVIPDVDAWLAKMAFYIQICDITFSDAVRSERHISEQRVSEAQALCRTYLSFFLPNWLPPCNPVSKETAP